MSTIKDDVVVSSAMRDALLKAAIQRVDSAPAGGNLKTVATIAQAAKRGAGQKRRKTMWSVGRAR